MSEHGRCFSMGWATLSGPVAVEEERLETAAISSAGEKREQKDDWTPGTWLGGAELSEVASGSATQGLWLRNGKVRSQVSGIGRSRFPGRRTVWEIRGGGRRGRRASDRAKKRVYRFRVRFG